MFNLFVTKAKHNQLLKSFYKNSQIAQLNNRITVAKAALSKE